MHFLLSTILAMAQIRVFQTTLSNGNGYIFVTNVDIPSVLFRNLDVLQRVRALVDSEYDDPTLEVYFEVSSTYTLINSETGSTRRWVGSFSPQESYALTPELLFRHHFEPTVGPLLDLAALLRQLQLLVPDTTWEIDEIHSLIIHVSAQVPADYPRLYFRGLLSQHGSRTGRRIKEFVLP